MTDSTPHEEQSILNQMNLELSSELDSVSIGLLGAEVGMESLRDMMEYFSTMLIHALELLSTERGLTMTEVKDLVEQELGLEGKFDLLLKRLNASNDVVQQTITRLKNN